MVNTNENNSKILDITGSQGSDQKELNSSDLIIPKTSLTARVNEKQIVLLEAIKVVYGFTTAEAMRFCIDEMWKERGEEIVRKAEYIISSRNK